mmetsp:Transcript_7918/g.8731  ORF Transcript_7918/g.8731 Transcript_7918/m.8731 type:complete len:152 (+) Transcript_7918:282-737(+)
MEEKNSRMKERIKAMEHSVSKIDEYKQILTQIAELENFAIDDLEEDLKTKQDILEQNEIGLVGSTIDNIIDVLLKADLNQDQEICEDELELVISNIEGIQNINLNDELIHQKLDEYGNNIEAVIRLLIDVFDEDPTTAPVAVGETFYTENT